MKLTRDFVSNGEYPHSCLSRNQATALVVFYDKQSSPPHHDRRKYTDNTTLLEIQRDTLEETVDHVQEWSVEKIRCHDMFQSVRHF